MRMLISGYNRIPNHLNTLRVDAKIFVSAKKYLRKKKFPDTCGHGVSSRFVPMVLSYPGLDVSYPHSANFVPNPLDDSYPTNCDTKCSKETNIYSIYPSNRKTIKMHARTRKAYV